MARKKRRTATRAHSLPLALRTAIGAFVGIVSVGAVSNLWADAGSNAPLLVAPLGATAMLLFSAPARSFARPYAVLAGNAIAAIAGLVFAQLMGTPVMAAALALGTAILVMRLFRAVHPPSGGVALVAALAGAQPLASAFQFLLVNVLLNSVLLIGVAFACNAAADGLARWLSRDSA